MSAYERSSESCALIPPRKGSPPKCRDSQEARFILAPSSGGRFHLGTLIGRPCITLCRIVKKPIFLREGLLACCLSRT